MTSMVSPEIPKACTFGEGDNIHNPKMTCMPDPGARYRFKQMHLRLLSTFANVRVLPGWILPTASSVLINVSPTTDAEIWRGQVEGSEECGIFLRRSVERITMSSFHAHLRITIHDRDHVLLIDSFAK